MKIKAHRPERWEYDRVDGRQLVLLSNSATVSFAYTYDPWGVQTLTAGGGGNGAAQNPHAFHGNGAGQNPYAFHAGIKDPGSGLVKFGQRWYNPTTGTWTQQDTLDNPLDPANANRYAYAGDDPINGQDPRGLSKAGCIALGAIAAGAGLVVVGALLVGAASAPTLVGPVAGSGTALVAGGIGAIVGARAFVECTFFNN